MQCAISYCDHISVNEDWLLLDAFYALACTPSVCMFFCWRQDSYCATQGYVDCSDKFARIIIHDKNTRRAHLVGMRFADGNVGAKFKCFEAGRRAFVCLNDYQVLLSNGDECMTR